MIVNDVALLQADWSEDTARWNGRVLFGAREDLARIVVEASATLPRHASAPAIRVALLDTAAAKLRRMPEYRRHPERLVVPVEVMAIAAAR